ncbi:MAG: nitroreductase family deazaflavin-dependent oxidoreductase [Chloroflexota bacterium]
MANQNPIHKMIRTIAKTKAGSKLFSMMLHYFDRPVLKWTNGRYSVASLLAGLPIINLTTIGRKSGQPRTMPLIGIPDGDNLIVIGSNWGGKAHPAWTYNLLANPEATVLVNGRSQKMMAHLTQGAEREAAWDKAVDVYLGYQNYEKWADHRNIRVMVLAPVG